VQLANPATLVTPTAAVLGDIFLRTSEQPEEENDVSLMHGEPGLDRRECHVDEWYRRAGREPAPPQQIASTRREI
jgi:hypothetical protein